MEFRGVGFAPVDQQRLNRFGQLVADLGQPRIARQVGHDDARTARCQSRGKRFCVNRDRNRHADQPGAPAAEMDEECLRRLVQQRCDAVAPCGAQSGKNVRRSRGERAQPGEAVAGDVAGLGFVDQPDRVGRCCGHPIDEINRHVVARRKMPAKRVVHRAMVGAAQPHRIRQPILRFGVGLAHRNRRNARDRSIGLDRQPTALANGASHPLSPHGPLRVQS